MDIRKIKKLIELVEESGIAELEITEGEESVRIHRGGVAPVAPVYAPAPAAPAAAPVAPSAAPEAAPTSPNTPNTCLLYTSPSPRDGLLSRMPSSA